MRRSDPTLAFCSTARPFSELRFQPPARGRNRLINRLVVEFRKLENSRHDSFYAKLFKEECMEPSIVKFAQFVQVLAALHPEAEIHLLFESHLAGAHGYPTVQEWLSKQPRVQLHYAPLAKPNGPQWTDLAEHWLQTIAAWPMQATLVASVQRMTQILEAHSPDQSEQLMIC